jgi:hypothetical protein
MKVNMYVQTIIASSIRARRSLVSYTYQDGETRRFLQQTASPPTYGYNTLPLLAEVTASLSVQVPNTKSFIMVERPQPALTMANKHPGRGFT